MGRLFNGTTDTIAIPGVGTPIDITGQAITISIWLNIATVPSGEQDPFTKSSASQTQYEFWISNATLPAPSKVGIYFRQSTPLNHDVYLSSTTNISANVWTNVCASWSASSIPGLSGIPKLYMNGVFQSNTTGGAGASIQSSGTNAQVGGKDLVVNFAGICGEIAVWDAELSAGEMISLAYVSPQMVRRTALVGYFPMWGISGTEPDLSGNSQNGTLTGTHQANNPPVAQFNMTR